MKQIKYRAYLKWVKIILEVKSIDFERKIIYCKTELNKSNPCDFYSFDDVILMQYTGLKDKNGVEIYEGDIANSKIFGVSQIRYYKNSFTLWSFYGDFARCYLTDDIKVIGNIYENKELLKNDKEEN